MRLARERLRLSITEVAQQTLISSRYLIAIEEENWAELPEDVHTKGYIRSYARLLGLDGEDLWQQAVSSRNYPTSLSSIFPPPTTTRESGTARLVSQVREEDDDLSSEAASLQEDLRVVAPISLGNGNPSRRDPSQGNSGKPRKARGSRFGEKEKQLLATSGVSPSQPVADAPLNQEPLSGSPRSQDQAVRPTVVPANLEGRERQRRVEYQQRLLLIRRRRILVSIAIWVVILLVCAVAIWFFVNGGTDWFNLGG